ncbi:8486_t:CDS:2, partial [Ambispora gerdemannii]
MATLIITTQKKFIKISSPLSPLLQQNMSPCCLTTKLSSLSLRRQSSRNYFVVHSPSSLQVSSSSLNNSISQQKKSFSLLNRTATVIVPPHLRQKMPKQQSRHANTSIRLRYDDFGIIDPFSQPAKMPSPLKPLFYYVIYRRLSNFFKNTFNVGLMYLAERKSKNVERWNPIRFKKNALDKYKEMNLHYAAGNLKALSKICHEQMTLKSQLKQRTIGNYIWEFLDLVDRPKIVNIRSVQLGAYAELTLQQVIVRFHSEQNGKLIGGGPTKYYKVLEHVVFQRCLWENEPNWLIYGYYFLPMPQLPPLPPDYILGKGTAEGESTYKKILNKVL